MWMSGAQALTPTPAFLQITSQRERPFLCPQGSSWIGTHMAGHLRLTARTGRGLATLTGGALGSLPQRRGEQASLGARGQHRGNRHTGRKDGTE